MNGAQPSFLTNEIESMAGPPAVEPELAAFKWVKAGLDLGACALGAKGTIHDLDVYIDDPTAVNQIKLINDDISTVLGCALTGLTTH